MMQRERDWSVERFVVTRDGRVLALFSKSFSHSRGSAMPSLGSTSTLVEREKVRADAVPGDVGWSGVLVEAGGRSYISWDAGQLVRGVVGLEVSRVRHRVELVCNTRAAVLATLSEAGLTLASGAGDGGLDGGPASVRPEPPGGRASGPCTQWSLESGTL